jgi:DNA polymerase-3 subunit beta
MKLTVDREAMLAACQAAAAALPGKDIKPVLRNLKAVATPADGDAPSRLTLVATDLEVGVRVTLTGLDVGEPGEALLPPRLAEALREARDASLAVDAGPDSCSLRGLLSPLEYEIPAEPPGTFPDFPAFDGGRFHELSAGTLREMAARASFAAASGEQGTARGAMCGVMWDLDGGKALLAATDGRRLAACEGVATAHGGHSARSAIVPLKAMALLRQHLAGEPGAPVQVCFRPNDVLFRAGDAEVYSRLIEGRFPDYQAILPKKFATAVTVPAGPLAVALRQAAVMADRDTRRVTFDFAAGRLRLSSESAGRSRVELALEGLEGPPVVVLLDSRYVLDMLKVLPKDAPVDVSLAGPLKPVLFASGPWYRYVVMPQEARK